MKEIILKFDNEDDAVTVFKRLAAKKAFEIAEAGILRELKVESSNSNKLEIKMGKSTKKFSAPLRL